MRFNQLTNRIIFNLNPLKTCAELARLRFETSLILR